MGWSDIIHLERLPIQKQARRGVELIVSIIVAQSAGVVGSMFTVSTLRTWYIFLVKPWWQPPIWLFAPAWMLLYTFMGTAAHLVWQKRRKKIAQEALRYYIFQLLLNAAWPFFFFALRAPGLALIEISLLLVTVILTTKKFWRVDPISGILMLPYVAWVVYATALNFSIWQMNFPMWQVYQ